MTIEERVQEIIERSDYVNEGRREWLALMMEFTFDHTPNILARRQLPTEKELVSINCLLANTWKIKHTVDRIAVLRSTYVMSAYSPLWRQTYEHAHQALMLTHDTETVNKMTRGLNKNYERTNYA